MSLLDYQTLFIAVTIGMSASLLGVFLVLRKLAMMVDAISHTIILGIVFAYLVTNDLNSPLVIIGATLMGVLTSFLIEWLIKTKRVAADAATGTIFPLLFSIAIIILSTSLKYVHLDAHVVTGNLEFSAFEQLNLFGQDIGARALYIGIFILVVVVLFIKIFFKELKIISFDSVLALSLGIFPSVIHYLFMMLVSLATVQAFNVVGVVMVLALMIGPPATALLFSKGLKQALCYAVTISIINTAGGYFIAMFVFNGDVNIASVISTLTLITFLLVWVFEPKKGLITKLIYQAKRKSSYELAALMLHIANHSDKLDFKEELHETKISKHLMWQKTKIDKYIHQGMRLGYIEMKNSILYLTDKGSIYHNQVIQKLIES